MPRHYRDVSYYTLAIEASFVAIERTVEFRLLERGTVQLNDLPGTHPGVYREAAMVGIFDPTPNLLSPTVLPPNLPPPPDRRLPARGRMPAG